MRTITKYFDSECIFSNIITVLLSYQANAFCVLTLPRNKGLTTSLILAIVMSGAKCFVSNALWFLAKNFEFGKTLVHLMLVPFIIQFVVYDGARHVK